MRRAWVLAALLCLQHGCGEAASVPSPAEVVASMKATGLRADNPRDNTGACTFEGQPAQSCDGLTTTDQVSVYLWPSDETAIRFAGSSSCDAPDTARQGGVSCVERIGRYVVKIGGDSDHPVPDAQPYVDAVRSAASPK